MRAHYRRVIGGWRTPPKATLVRDGEPVLTVVSVPLTCETYTALAGRGSLLNCRPVKVSVKREGASAIVASGQVRPGEPKAILAEMLRSADALLLVRLSVPSMIEWLTLPPVGWMPFGSTAVSAPG